MAKEPIGPDKDLINRAFRMKPVMQDRDGHLYFIEPKDLYDKLYDMDGTPDAGLAGSHVKKIADIDIRLPATLWGGACPGPTQEQVLPQLPDSHLGETVVAFEAHMADDHEGQNGYVRASVTLYGGTLPDDIKTQPVIAWKKTYKEPFPPPEKPKAQFNVKAATTLEADIQAMKPLELKKTGIIAPSGNGAL